MALPVPQPGLVIRYSYLWHAEHEQGQEEGSKDRPCAIVLSYREEHGDTIVTVVPITHTPPHPHTGQAVEIPPATKRRLGLDDDQSWIIVSEVNRFVWPGPDLRSISRNDPARFDYGFLPPGLFEQVKQRLLASAKAQRLPTVGRTE